MAKKKSGLTKDQKGRFIRNLGKIQQMVPPFNLIRPKFYLGTDETKAVVANARLEQVWEIVVQQWTDREVNTNDLPDEPLFDWITIEIAKAVAKGQLVFKVPKSEFLGGDAELNTRWLTKLANRFAPVIELVPQFEEEFKEVRQRQNVQLVKLILEHNPQNRAGQTIGQAIEALMVSIEKKYTQPEGDLMPWGKTQLNQLKSWRRYLTPELLATDLSNLTIQTAQELVSPITCRPLTFESKQTSRMTTKSTESIVKRIKHFFEWLDLSDDWKWDKPPKFGKIDYKIAPLTNDEKHEKKIDRDNWRISDDEIKILYSYATPVERVLILLGLNCAFGAGEIGNLRIPYVKFETQEIDGIRFKTGNDTRHHLWEETIAGLKWELDRRTHLPKTNKSKDILFLSEKGDPLWHSTKSGNYKSGVVKRWNDLKARVKKDHPEFAYSFGKLRKTAAIRVIEMADAEAASMILAHGIPTEDKLLSAYVNIPWEKLYAAQKAYGETIRPLITIEKPFEQPPKDYLGKTRAVRILEQYKAGVPVSAIAKEAGVHIQTVYRHIDRAGLRQVREVQIEKAGKGI
jgi:integrase